MDLIDNVKQRATAQLDSQKGRATDSISSIANAVRGSSSQLRGEQHDVLAQYVETFADQLERLSNNVRGKDVNELLDGARDFARRQPALFVGGSFAVGLLAARFLKSSGQDAAPRNSGRSDYPLSDSAMSDSALSNSALSDYPESPRNSEAPSISTARASRPRKGGRSSSPETR
jgi:hypothetical protein